MLRPLEEFLSMDLTRYQRRLDSLWGKIHGTAFGLNLYLYPSPHVSSFSISVISVFYFLSCFVVKIAAVTLVAHRVQPFHVIRIMAPP